MVVARRDGGSTIPLLFACTTRPEGFQEAEKKERSRKKMQAATKRVATSSFRFAGIQLMVGTDKAANLENARHKISEAVSKGAQVVALPVSRRVGLI